MMRSHDALTGAQRRPARRRGVTFGFGFVLHADTPNPTAAMLPVVRNVRLCMCANSTPKPAGALAAGFDRDDAVGNPFREAVFRLMRSCAGVAAADAVTLTQAFEPERFA